MDQLIDTIRAATAIGASTDQKAAGVQACRTIIAALDTEPGKPIVLPGTPSSSTGARLSIDQVLDLVIARLTTIANERDKKPLAALPSSRALRSSGLRVPAIPATSPRPAPRPAAKPAAATKPPATKKP